MQRQTTAATSRYDFKRAGSAIILPAKSSNRRGKSLAERHSQKVDRSAGFFGCWPWTGSTMQANGYGQISAISPKTGKHTMRCAHVVAFELAYGPVPKRKRILHARGCCYLCCNPLHLRAGSAAENTADARADGRLSKRLNVSEAKQIARFYRDGTSIKDLAARFDVSPVSITNIIRGKTYSKHTGIARHKAKGGRPPKLAVIIGGKGIEEERAAA